MQEMYQHHLFFKKEKKLSFLSGGSVVKNPPANAGSVGSNPGLGRSPTPVFLPGKTPWIEEHGRPQFMRSQIVRHD